MDATQTQREYLVDEEGKSLVVRIPWYHHLGIIQHMGALTPEEAQRMKDVVETNIKERVVSRAQAQSMEKKAKKKKTMPSSNKETKELAIY